MKETSSNNASLPLESSVFPLIDLPNLIIDAILSSDYFQAWELAQLKSIDKRFNETIDLRRKISFKRVFKIDSSVPRSLFNALMTCAKRDNGCFQFLWETFRPRDRRSSFYLSKESVRALAYSSLRHNTLHLLNVMNLSTDPELQETNQYCLDFQYLLSLTADQRVLLAHREPIDLESQRLRALLRRQTMIEFELAVNRLLLNNSFVLDALQFGASVTPLFLQSVHPMTLLVNQVRYQYPRMIETVKFLLKQWVDINDFVDPVSLIKRTPLDAILSASLSNLVKRCLEQRLNIDSIHRKLNWRTHQLHNLLDSFGFDIKLTIGKHPRFNQFKFEYQLNEGTTTEMEIGEYHWRNDFQIPIDSDGPLLMELVNELTDQELPDEAFQRDLRVMRLLLKNGANLSTKGAIHIQQSLSLGQNMFGGIDNVLYTDVSIV